MTREPAPTQDHAGPVPASSRRDGQVVRVGAADTLLRAMPHLPAFWPEAETVGLGGERGFDHEWVSRDAAPTGAAVPLRFDPGPFAPPRFGPRQAPPILFVAPGAAGDPLAALLDAAARQAPAEAAQRERAIELRAALAESRIGGVPGLPDPGPRALGCGRAEAVIVLDPCDPARAVATRRLWLRATARAGGRPVRSVRSPATPAGATATLPATLPSRLAPWTILDAAAELHVLDDGLGLLGLMAGAAVHAEATAPFAPWAAGGSRDGLDLLATIAGLARCADPFRRRPWSFEEAIALLAEWRRAAEENAGIAVCVGMSFWKRDRMAAALASADGAPAFRRTAAGAVAEAHRRGGAVAVWASRCPRDLPARAAAAQVPLCWVEDGFIRSAGLGAGFLPGASLALDAAPAVFRSLGARPTSRSCWRPRTSRRRSWSRGRGAAASLRRPRHHQVQPGRRRARAAGAPGGRASWCPARWRTTCPSCAARGRRCGTNLDLLRACVPPRRTPSSPTSRIRMSRPATGAAPCPPRKPHGWPTWC
jgi:capsular polysaccharide export protein